MLRVNNKLQAIYESLNHGEKEALEQRMRDEGTTAAWISRTLTKHGHAVGVTTVKEARRQMRETEVA